CMPLVHAPHSESYCAVDVNTFRMTIFLGLGVIIVRPSFRDLPIEIKFQSAVVDRITLRASSKASRSDAHARSNKSSGKYSSNFSTVRGVTRDPSFLGSLSIERRFCRNTLKSAWFWKGNQIESRSTSPAVPFSSAKTARVRKQRVP